MTRWRPWVALLISLVGLADATYLTYSHYSDPTEKALTCPLGSSHSLIDCAAVLTSKYSDIFGLPVALYGALFFLFMVFINLPPMWRSPSMWIARFRVAAVVAGMAMVLYLVFVEFLLERHVCLWCSSVHILQFALFMVVLTGLNDTGYAASRWDEYEEEDAEAKPSPPEVAPARV